MSKKSEGLKIYFIISVFYPVIGGAEQECMNVARELTKRGIEVEVVTRRLKGLSKKEFVHGIPIRRVFCMDSVKSLPIKSLMFTISASFYILFNKIKGKSRGKKLIVHSFQALSPARIAVLSKYLCKAKAISNVAGVEIEYLNKFKGQWTFKWALNGLDKILTKGDNAQEVLKDSNIVKDVHSISIMRNGVDTEKFSPLDTKEKDQAIKKLGLSNQKIRVIFVGRLHKVKNAELLIKAWSSMKRELREKAELVFVGDGEERQGLELSVQKLNLDESVVFCGKKLNTSEYLQASDIFVLPSTFEGLSNALLEAGACGLAVIATNVGETNKVLEGQNKGVIIQSNNVNALTDALETLIRSEKTRKEYGSNLRKHIEGSYSIKAVIDQYMNLYMNI